jgi:trigger factor
LNIQTERLENHTARFTVELDAERLEQAKQEAARKLAKRVNVPGFRKGKVPYRILVSYVGEGAVLEDAVEILGNQIYKEALDESGVDPYGPGELEDFKTEPQPTFTFVVPLQPTVSLGDYRSVRLDFEPPTVDDDAVNKSMKMLQEQQALVEESHQPVAPGNRVSLSIHGHLLDEKAETEDEGAEGEAKAETEAHDEHEHEHDHDHEEGHQHGHEGQLFIDEHNAVLVLDDEHEEPAPGFYKAIEGLNAGDEKDFELTYPDDQEEYEDLAGKRAQFFIKINKIETMTVPSLNDDLAARITASEEKPLTLLELRMRVRENLQKAAEQRSKSEYANRALDRIVEGATIAFPDALVHDQTERMLERLDRDLRQQGLTLEDYMRIMNKTREQVAEDYREPAIENLKKSLVLREVVNAEGVTVDESAIDAEIDRIAAQFGDQAELLRPALDTPTMRDNVRNDLLEQSVLDRIVQIAKGEAPELQQTSSQESQQGEPVQNE